MCRGCKAHQAHIESLEKQLDFFREQLNPRPRLWTPEAVETSITDSPLPTFEELPWVSEEEEELQAMKQAGLIDPSELQSALAQVGAFSTDIHIDA